MSDPSKDMDLRGHRDHRVISAGKFLWQRRDSMEKTKQ